MNNIKNELINLFNQQTNQIKQMKKELTCIKINLKNIRKIQIQLKELYYDRYFNSNGKPIIDRS